MQGFIKIFRPYQTLMNFQSTLTTGVISTFYIYKRRRHLFCDSPVKENDKTFAFEDELLKRRKELLFQWQVCDLIYPFFRICGLGDYFQIIYALTNRDIKLMSVNHT